MLRIKVRDSNEEVNVFKHIFGVFGVRIKGAIHYFQFPNSFNQKFSELNNNDDIIIHDH